MVSRHSTRLLGLVLFVVSAAASGHAATNDPTNRPIGLAQRSFEDPQRLSWPGTAPRPVRVTLWYPAAVGGTAVEVEDNHDRLTVHRDAPVAARQERYPLVLLSPGSGGEAAYMFWLGRALAARQMIVAAVDHNGSEAEELGLRRPTPTDFFAWERAADLSVALDRLLGDAEWSDWIDPECIGAAGFSLGGTTALWTAGARLDLEALRAGSPPPPPAIAAAIENLVALSQTHPVARASVDRAPDSYRDERVRAVFALAPPMGAGFTPAGLADVTVPVCIVVGDADVIAPAAGNAQHFAALLRDVRLHVLPGERGHYIKPLPADQQRSEMREVAKLAADFFEQTLQPEARR